MSEVAKQGPFKVSIIPEQDELLIDDEVEHYPYNKTFEESRNDPFYVVHTSGSTGVPKPIVCTHGHHGVWDAGPRVPADDKGNSVRHRFTPNTRIMNCAPLFHVCLLTLEWYDSMAEHEAATWVLIRCNASNISALYSSVWASQWDTQLGYGR